jgi:hypothetical protein
MLKKTWTKFLLVLVDSSPSYELGSKVFDSKVSNFVGTIIET